MECLITVAMVNAINYVRSGERAGVPSTVDRLTAIYNKMENYIAFRGVVFPLGCRKINILTRWVRMIDLSIVSAKPSQVFRLANTYLSFLNEQASDYVRRVSELCEIFNIELNDDELDLELVKYQLLLFLGIAIPQLKFSTNLVFNRFHRVELPEGSSRDFLGYSIFPRRLVCRFKIMNSERNRRSFDAWVRMNTVFQGFKKGLLPSEPELIQKTLDKHRVALTKSPEISDEIGDHIDRFLEQMFPGGMSFNLKDTKNQSSHSTTQYGYAEGGNIGFSKDLKYGYIRRDAQSKDERRVRTTVVVPELVGFVSKRGNGGACPEAVYSSEFLTLKEMMESFPKRVIDLRGPNDRPFDTCLEATPACIIEPMKVRLITKPSVGLHTEFHCIQKQLREFLFKEYNDFFALTGEPLRRDHLWRIIGSQLEFDEIMVSGDYSAATDNLKGDVSTKIAKWILQKAFCNDPVRIQNAIKSLTGLQILQTNTMLPKFPPGSCYSNFTYMLEDFLQQNGQLMGNVLSFPILCIANLFAYWLSLERYIGRELNITQLRKHPAMINGDDILFKSNHEHYKIWLKTVEEFGFSPSVGKNFGTQRFLQINSELWRIDTRFSLLKGVAEVTNLVKIPYVNFGLMTNRSKQDCSVDFEMAGISKTAFRDLPEASYLGRFACLPKVLETLIDGLPPKIEGIAKDILFRHQRPVMREFGLESYRSLLLLPGFQSMFKQLFTTGMNRDDVLRQECLGNLCTKLWRGELEFRYKSVRLMEWWIRITGGLCFIDPSIFVDLEEEAEVEYVCQGR